MWYHTTDYTGGIKVTEDGSLGGVWEFASVRSVFLFGGGKSKGRIKFLLLLLLLRKKTGVNKFLVSSFLQQMGGFARSVLLLHERNLYSHDSTFSLLLLNQVR
jgi:hypothetical protein